MTLSCLSTLANVALDRPISASRSGHDFRKCAAPGYAYVVLSLLAAAALSPVTYFVALTGSDHASGLTATKHGHDGPFATLPHALEAVRHYRASHPDRIAPIRIEVEAGEYDLAKTIEIGPEDSGTAASPTIVEGYIGARPFITGATRYKLQPDPNFRVWSAQIPFRVEQLYIHGTRAQRARWPKDGYSIIDRTVASTPDVGSKGFNRFGFAGGDIKPEWARTGEAEVLAFHLWTMDRMPLAAADEATKTAMIGGFCLPASYSSLDKGTRYIIENIPHPGEEEWYQDYKTGRVDYVLPRVICGAPEAEAPRLDTLVELKGSGDNPIHNLVFRNLDFAFSAYLLPRGGHAFGQADIDVPAAIEAAGVRNCEFEKIGIYHTGGWGIAFHVGCQSDILRNSILSDLGAGGVKVGETAMPKAADDLANNITVDHCLIEHGGRIHPAATGVWIGESASDNITHNTITDFYYTGVSIGWVWGYGPSMTRDIRVADNVITDIGQEVLSDMGGIYTLGNETGTVLRHNFISNVNGFYYGGWGVYFDEGTTNIEAVDNLVTNCKTGCFHQHYGKDNRITNNIFAYSKEAGLIIRTRAEDHLSLRFDHNIAVNNGPMFASNWSGNGYELDHNLYWNPHPGPGDFAGKTWAQWQAEGRDAGSIFENPGFSTKYWPFFEVRKSCPAIGLGFRPFEMNGFGAGIIPSPMESPSGFPPAFPTFRRNQYPQNIQ